MSEYFAVQTQANSDRLRRRTLIVALVLALWMLIIGTRLFYLQTSQHGWLSAHARAQHQGAVSTNPSRGLILDRAGRELVRSVDCDSFFAVPSQIADPHQTATRLAPVLEADSEALATRLAEAKRTDRKFVWIARKLDQERAEKVQALELHGIYAHKESKRFYPNGRLAAHVLGFVDTDELGLAGVEQFHNAPLAGKAGRLFIEEDGRRRSYESFETQPRPGQTVVLTIDRTIQFRTEQALATAVANTRARTGTAIVLDPRSGEVLALAGVPAFDPNEAGNSSAAARTNEALQNIYEPGSTFKIVAYAAAIEEKLIQPEDRIDCQMGAIDVAGRIVRDHHPYGMLSMTEALAKSSNVAAIKLASRVGRERMYDYITRFGFGVRTGIELPGETPGLLRPVARWQPSSIASIAIGQEIGATPLQVAAAFGALANDGVRVAPHLVREVRHADGRVLRRTTPSEQRVTSVRTARALRGMLESVTVEGTAKRAQLSGYRAAGKTGTAQKIDPRTKAYSKTKYVASFVGFAPVENPSVVIIVVINEPTGAYYGGEVAAPVFREIAESVLPYLNVAPNAGMPDAGADVASDARTPARTGSATAAAQQVERANNDREMFLPRHVQRTMQGGASEVVYAVASGRTILMPNLFGQSVRDAARVCAQLGLQIEARGEGRASRQRPAAGREIEVGQIVRVNFAKSD
ncbi:MAG: transpeptidase family protein [Pyrinomonadaceae bacterium]|nr:transpeptidase family protein [Pyrinomonadaceae bacterium]